jgi:hypothetical protein
MDCVMQAPGSTIRISWNALWLYAVHPRMQLVSFTMSSHPIGIIVLLGSVAAASCCYWCVVRAAVSISRKHNESYATAYSCFRFRCVTRESGPCLWLEWVANQDQPGGCLHTDDARTYPDAFIVFYRIVCMWYSFAVDISTIMWNSPAYTRHSLQSLKLLFYFFKYWEYWNSY